MKKIIGYVSFVIRSSPVGFLTSCLLYICNLLFAAGLYGTASLIISLAALHPTYDILMIPVVCVRMFGLGRAVLSYTERYCSHDNTFRILKNLRLKLYDKMVPVLPMYGIRRGQNLSMFISDIELLQEGILRLVYPMVSSVFLLLAGLGIAYLLHPLLALVFLPLFICNYYLFPALMFYFNTKKKNKIDYDKKKLYEDMLELKEGINEITSDGREKDWINRIEEKLFQMNGTMYEHQSAVALCEAGIVMLQGISVLALAFVATSLAVKGELSGVYLATAILALTTLVTEAILPSQTYFQFSGLKRAANNVLEEEIDTDRSFNMEKAVHEPEEIVIESQETVLESQKIVLESQKIVPRLVKIDLESEEIVIKPDKMELELEKTALESEVIMQELGEETLQIHNISYGYPDLKKIFNHFSLEIKKGTIIAVMGESGCGKSTLINLILGFLKPSEGEIFVGGKSLLVMSESERFRYFSVVDQKPFFFHQTIFENLRLANPQADEEQMMEVLGKVSLQNLITSSESGLHTYVYEWGANLSGGELQRLAIARALLKEAPFYIFDEPTAGLDTINEKIIMDLIFELSKEHGVLLITHRPNMIQKFHSVIRL